jgi:hypothetical protein
MVVINLPHSQQLRVIIPTRSDPAHDRSRPLLSRHKVDEVPERARVDQVLRHALGLAAGGHVASVPEEGALKVEADVVRAHDAVEMPEALWGLGREGSHVSDEGGGFRQWCLDKTGLRRVRNVSVTRFLRSIIWLGAPPGASFWRRGMAKCEPVPMSRLGERQRNANWAEQVDDVDGGKIWFCVVGADGPIVTSD